MALLGIGIALLLAFAYGAPEEQNALRSPRASPRCLFKIVGAIGQGKPYRRDLIDFVGGQIPDLRNANDSAILNFAKTRALSPAR